MKRSKLVAVSDRLHGEFHQKNPENSDNKSFLIFRDCCIAQKNRYCVSHTKQWRGSLVKPNIRVTKSNCQVCIGKTTYQITPKQKNQNEKKMYIFEYSIKRFQAGNFFQSALKLSRTFHVISFNRLSFTLLISHSYSLAYFQSTMPL